MSEVLYNVTINVEENIVDAWYDWLLNHHLRAIMDTGLFKSYRLSRLVHPKQEQGITFSIQLLSESMQMVNSYLKNHAANIDQVHYTKFGDQCLQFSTIMELIEEA